MSAVLSRRQTGLVLALTLLCSMTFATKTAGAGTSTSSTSFQVSVIDQTTSLESPSSTSGSLFSINLGFSPSIDPSASTVRFQLFPSIYASSILLQDVAAPPISGAIATTGPVDLSCVTSGTQTGRFVIGFAASGGVRPAPQLGGTCSGPAPVFRLSCSGASCSGVYPIVISTLTHGVMVNRRTTFVDLTSGTIPHKVRVALVVPLSPLLPGAIPSATSALHTVMEHPRVSMTIAPEPSLLAQARLEGASLGSILEKTAKLPHHAVLADSYVPIDPTWLRTHGLGGEIAEQRSEGLRELSALGLSAGPALTPLLLGKTSMPLSSDLRREGADTVIVNGQRLTIDPSTTYGWGQPFQLSSGTGVIKAAALDHETDRFFRNASHEPGLAATQLLGYLAFRFHQAPGLSAPRGVVLVPSRSTALPPRFLNVLLDGLASSKDLDPVTVPTFFATVPMGVNGAPTTRYSVPSNPSVDPGTAIGIRQGRTICHQLAEMLRLAPATAQMLNHLLLEAEATGRPSLPRLHAFQRAVAGLAHSITVPSSSFTLTSQQGTLTLTIVSTAKSLLRVHVNLVSDHLSFPRGSGFDLTLRQSATAVRIPVIAQTTGVLPLQVMVTAAGNTFPLASAALTVQVAAASIVGILLTVGAIGVLGWWWFSTWRKGRKAKRTSRG
ncbi:MAG: hypothetical protein WCL38_03605 [Actinomycetota bacterium]